MAVPFSIVSLTAKGDTFGHEISHLFGAEHNRKHMNGFTGNNVGNLVKKADGTSSGFHTIMA